MCQDQGKGFYPILEFVDTAILKLTDFSHGFPVEWPAIGALRDQPRSIIEQHILSFKSGTVAAHHTLYQDKVMAALERYGAKLLGLFDTVIGPGTMNMGSHRSVELCWFPDMIQWQNWRDAQDRNEGLSALVKSEWLAAIERVDSVLMQPMDYSRIW